MGMYSRKNIRWKRAILIMMAVFAIILSATPSVSAAVFTDVKGHWAEAQITDWQERGLISGYPDGSFQPDWAVTRAEFMVMINHAFGYTEESSVTFPDVKSTDWYYHAVAKAVAAGYIKGYPDGSMCPNIPISRQEAAVILCRILNIDVSDVKHEKNFADDKDVANWSKGSVDAVVNNGYMVGYPDHTFRSQNDMTRAEAVTILSRAAKMVLAAAGVYGPETGTKTISGDVTISASGITLRNTVIEGDLYLAEGIGDGQVTLKNVTVKGHTYISGGGSASPAGITLNNTSLGDVNITGSAGSAIRVVASGSTEVGTVDCGTDAVLEENELTGDGFGDVNIPGGAKVELSGSFDQVTITGDNADLNISGTVETLTVESGASSAEITVGSGATVNTMTLNAAATVTGAGVIGTANLNVSGSTVEQWPVTVNLAENVIGTICGITVGSAVEQDGTEDHPYLIYTAGDLDSVRGGVKGHEGWDLTKSYKLMADIDLSAYEAGAGWEPLGNWSTYFTGSFDGNGYAISNLYINRPADYGVGLFGATDGTKLKKISVINADITGCGYTGGLVGSAEDGTMISSCSVQGDIKAYDSYAGGITGYFDDGTIQNCYAVGNVSAATYCAGGLVGENDGTVESSYVFCSVSGSQNIGGFVGYNYGTIADSNYVLGGGVTSIDGGCSYWGETSFGRIAGANFSGKLCEGTSVSVLQFYANPINASGQNFSGMTGVNGIDAPVTIAFTGWDFIDIWKTGDRDLPVFQWQTDAAAPAAPLIRGVSAGGTFYSVSPSWTTKSGVTYTATVSKDGGAAEAFNSGSTIDTDGLYLLKVTATKTSSGLISTASMEFTIDRTPLSAPTINGVTAGATYNVTLPSPSYQSKYPCEETLSPDNATTFEPYSADLFAEVGVTEYVYQVTTKALTYPEVSTKVSFTVNGAGTKTKPFLVYTAADLAAMDDSSSYAWGYTGEYGDSMTPLYYELQNNIDLTGISWQALGDRYPSGSYAFCGVFDGNHHTVSNLTINDSERGYLGMFCLNEGRIYDLNLANVSVSGSYITGGLVGQNHGLISGCTISGSVSGGNFIGGLVGINYNSSNANITGCSSSVVVVASGNQGGGCLVGQNNSKINHCSATGNVRGSDYLGGLVGRTGTSSKIGTSFASGTVSGGNNLGGLVAENYGTVTDCYATGPVTGTGASVGGLVGTNLNSIDHCYASGNAVGGWYIGGLVGSNYSSITDVTATVTDSVAMGSASSIESSAQVGPVCGNNLATISNCPSGLADSVAKAKATYTALGWDFDTIWTIVEGSGYPTLR